MWKRIKALFKKEQTTPNVNVVINFTQEEIEEFAKKIPSSIITDKVIENLKKNNSIYLDKFIR